MTVATMPRARSRAHELHGGFAARVSLDDSPEALREVRLAVARAKEGDREAIRFLYVKYANNVYGYVRSILHDDHEAEDVTQQVFAKLMTALVRYEERGIPFFGWLLRLARNAAIDHLRRQRCLAHEPAPNALASHLDGGPVDEVERDRARCLEAALADLPEEQRNVVLLRHVVGLTPTEIATRMGRSEASIHGLHHRGRRSLQQALIRLDAAPSTAGGRAPAPQC